MVKEGHDSTVRPKISTFEFNDGRIYLDAWHSDGKSSLSKTFLGRLRVAKVLLCTLMPAAMLFGSDWGDDHVFTAPCNAVSAWWRTYVRMDIADVSKGQSVGKWRQALHDEQPSSRLS